MVVASVLACILDGWRLLGIVVRSICSFAWLWVWLKQVEKDGWWTKWCVEVKEGQGKRAMLYASQYHGSTRLKTRLEPSFGAL